jgi:nitroreductase
MEAGHAAQNIYLQATALDLAMVTVGTFYDNQVKDIMGMLEHEITLHMIPEGRKT